MVTIRHYIVTTLLLTTFFGGMALSMRWANSMDDALAREAVSHWYDCTVPTGEVYRVNYVYRHREEWQISGTVRVKGTGNLTCVEVQP